MFETDRSQPAASDQRGIPAPTAGPSALIAEDQPGALFLVSQMMALCGIQVLGISLESSSWLAALKRSSPSMIVLDLHMPGQLRPLELLSATLAHTEAKVVVYSSIAHPLVVAEVLRRGASAFVSKRSAAPVLHRAISSVASGSRYVDPAVMLHTNADHPWSTLTDAERSTMAAFYRGSSLKCIAMDTGRHYNTVQCHYKRAMEKLHVSNDGQLFKYLFDHGLNHVLDVT